MKGIKCRCLAITGFISMGSFVAISLIFPTNNALLAIFAIPVFAWQILLLLKCHSTNWFSDTE